MTTPLRSSNAGHVATIGGGAAQTLARLPNGSCFAPKRLHLPRGLFDPLRAKHRRGAAHRTIRGVFVTMQRHGPLAEMSQLGGPGGVGSCQGDHLGVRQAQLLGAASQLGSINVSQGTHSLQGGELGRGDTGVRGKQGVLRDHRVGRARASAAWR